MVSFFLLSNVFALAQTRNQVDQTYLYLYTSKIPEFKGGELGLVRYLKKNLKWPNTDIDTRGTVILSFVIAADGSVKNVKVEKSLSDEFDNEAKKVFSLMPKWIPGKVGTKNVAVKMYFPVSFYIDD